MLSRGLEKGTDVICLDSNLIPVKRVGIDKATVKCYETDITAFHNILSGIMPGFLFPGERTLQMIDITSSQSKTLQGSIKK